MRRAVWLAILAGAAATTGVSFTEPDAPTAASAPNSYTAPTVNGTTVVAVADDTELRALVAGARGVVTDVVLTGATYDNAAPLTIGATWHSARFWAQTVGSATVHYSWTMGGNGAAQSPYIRGIVWDIDGAGKLATVGGFTGAINLWGQSAQNATLLDLTIGTNGLAMNGISCGISLGAHAGDNIDIQRVVITDCQRFGIYLNPNVECPNGVSIVDADIERIFLPGATRGDGGGAYEHGIFATQSGTYSRIYIRDTGWSGITATGDYAANGTMTDIDVDYCGPSARLLRQNAPGSVGVYFDDAHDWTLTRIYAGPHLNIGVNNEWNGVDDGIEPAHTYNITIEHGDFECYKFGVLIQLTTDNISVDRCRFRRSWKAPIFAETGATNVTIGLNVYDLESGAVNTEATLSGLHGGWFEDPPSGWRMHPDQYDGELAPEDRAGAVFIGEAPQGSYGLNGWDDLATDLTAAGNDFTPRADRDCMELDPTTIFLDEGPWTFVIEFEANNASQDWLFRLRDNQASGNTIYGARIEPTSKELELSTDNGQYYSFASSILPDSATYERFILMFRLEEDGGTNTWVDLVNLTTGESDHTYLTHTAYSTDTTVEAVVGAEIASSSANDEYTDDIYRFYAYNTFPDPGQIARDLHATLVMP